VSLLTLSISAASPTLSAELKPSADGKTIIVVFSITNNPGIAGFRFTMNYDNTVLKPVQTVCKISDGLYIDNHETATTQLNVVWANGTNYTGNGELCSATFSVIGTVKDGQYPITITYDPADIVSIVDGDPKSISCEANGMTASVQTVSIQSEPSQPVSSENTGSQIQSASPVSASSSASAVSSIPSSSTISTGTSTPLIEVNSQVPVPDYTSAASENSITLQSSQSVSGTVQSSSGENSQTQSPGTESINSYPTLSQSSGEQIPTQSPDRKTPDILFIAVLIIAAGAAAVLIVFIIRRNKTQVK